MKRREIISRAINKLLVGKPLRVAKQRYEKNMKKKILETLSELRAKATTGSERYNELTEMIEWLERVEINER